jgi:hypothetical protein
LLLQNSRGDAAGGFRYYCQHADWFAAQLGAQFLLYRGKVEIKIDV